MKMLRLTRNSLILFAACCLALTGCRSKRAAQKPVEDMSAYTAAEVMRQQPQFRSMNIAKMDVLATYGQHQMSFKATARLFTDSLLQLSIQPMMGVEMFRVDFTPTDFRIVDKWNRRYTENTYDYLRYKLGVDFSFDLLQRIVSNQLFLVDKQVESTDFVVEKFEGEATRLVHLSQGMIQRFELVEPMAIAKAEVLTEQARLTCNYSGHRVQNGVRFPNEFLLTISADHQQVTLTCTVQKIEFNKSFEPLRTLALEKYEKVPFSKIIP